CVTFTRRLVAMIVFSGSFGSSAIVAVEPSAWTSDPCEGVAASSRKARLRTSSAYRPPSYAWLISSVLNPENSRLTLPDGDAVSIVTVGLAPRVMVRPNTNTNGNGHLAIMGDSTATIRASFQALDPTSRGPVFSRTSYKHLDAVELRDGLRERLELSDEGKHPALLLVDRLRAFEHVRRTLLRHHHDTVLVGNDDVARTDGDAGALDGYVLGHGGIVADGGTRRLRTRIDREA